MGQPSAIIMIIMTIVDKARSQSVPQMRGRHYYHLKRFENDQPKVGDQVQILYEKESGDPIKWHAKSRDTLEFVVVGIWASLSPVIVCSDSSVDTVAKSSHYKSFSWEGIPYLSMRGVCSHCWRGRRRVNVVGSYRQGSVLFASPVWMAKSPSPVLYVCTFVCGDDRTLSAFPERWKTDRAKEKVSKVSD